MKVIKSKDNKLFITTIADFVHDLPEAKTLIIGIDITKDVVTALNLRMANCIKNLEENISNGIYSSDGNDIIYTKDGIRRHFSVPAYTEMQKTVNMLSNGNNINNCSNAQHIQIVKALALMPADKFVCCEKELAIDIATECMLSDRY